MHMMESKELEKGHWLLAGLNMQFTDLYHAWERADVAADLTDFLLVGAVRLHGLA